MIVLSFQVMPACQNWHGAPSVRSHPIIERQTSKKKSEQYIDDYTKQMERDILLFHHVYYSASHFYQTWTTRIPSLLNTALPVTSYLPSCSDSHLSSSYDINFKFLHLSFFSKHICPYSLRESGEFPWGLPPQRI